MTTAVNYDTVTTAAGDVRATATYLNEQLETLLREVNRVVQDWDGESKQAYHEIQTQLAANLSGMNQELGTIARLLDDSVVGYRDTDKGNAARFRMMR
ncbi:WXG100 family type VII secretion target [Streptomyces formicae]|uniref:ESAT-6-like protein n=1 Tax=Streptomyces formicae TaxID=1616117 RepID=A0ABY3WGD1_9ACTN|nr:WXG100 family type VII secretion target [Streptomyces formicae]UNM11626.1 WXG100 family type VII secretion target [Streptomyces formicae]